MHAGGAHVGLAEGDHANRDQRATQRQDGGQQIERLVNP